MMFTACLINVETSNKTQQIVSILSATTGSKRTLTERLGQPIASPLPKCHKASFLSARKCLYDLCRMEIRLWR